MGRPVTFYGYYRRIDPMRDLRSLGYLTNSSKDNIIYDIEEETGYRLPANLLPKIRGKRGRRGLPNGWDLERVPSPMGKRNWKTKTMAQHQYLATIPIPKGLYVNPPLIQLESEDYDDEDISEVL